MVMKSVFFCGGSAILTFVAVILVVKYCNRISEKDYLKSEQVLERIVYVIFFCLPIGIYTIILKYSTIEPLREQIIWIGVFWISNMILSRFALRNASVEIKVALCFLSMILCLIYFIIQQIYEPSEKNLEMIYSMVLLILGFFVPLETLLNNDKPIEKLKSILKQTYIKELKNTKVVIGIIVSFCIYMCLETRYYKQMEAISVGVIVGSGIAVITVMAHQKNKCNEKME